MDTEPTSSVEAEKLPTEGEAAASETAKPSDAPSTEAEPSEEEAKPVAMETDEAEGEAAVTNGAPTVKAELPEDKAKTGGWDKSDV